MIPLNKVKDLINKHNALEKELSSGDIDKKKFADKSKEYSELNDIILEVKEYSSFEEEKNDPNNDNEMKDLAKTELKDLLNKN